MRYQVGDLVVKRTGEDFGVVVSVDKANSSSLATSQHSKNLLKNAPDIYYVFFPDIGRGGPYYTSELRLKQSNNGTAII